MNSISMEQVIKRHLIVNPSGHYFDRENIKALSSQFEREAYATADGAWAVFVETTKRMTLLKGYLDCDETDHYNVCFLDTLNAEEYGACFHPSIVGNERRDAYPTLQAAKEAAKEAVMSYDKINTQHAAYAILPDPHNRTWYLWNGGFHSIVKAYRMSDGLKFYGYALDCGPEGPGVETVKRSMRNHSRISYAASYNDLEAAGAKIIMPDCKRRMWFGWFGGSCVHVNSMETGETFHVFSIHTEADAPTPEEVKTNMREHMAEGYASDL